MIRAIPTRMGLIGSLPPLDGPRRRLTAIPGTVPDPQAMPQRLRFRAALRRMPAAPVRNDAATASRRRRRSTCCLHQSIGVARAQMHRSGRRMTAPLVERRRARPHATRCAAGCSAAARGVCAVDGVTLDDPPRRDARPRRRIRARENRPQAGSCSVWKTPDAGSRRASTAGDLPAMDTPAWRAAACPYADDLSGSARRARPPPADCSAGARAARYSRRRR